MARAKRTSRAEARRRYRAQLVEQDAAPEDGPSRPAEPPPRGSRTANEPRPAGMRYAFRAAFHPPNLREDFEHLPELLRSRAVLIPVLVSVGTAIAIAATNGTDVISRLLAQYFLVPPPIGSIFIAGFFAPRASYLAGLIVGLVAAIALTALIVATPSLSPTATPGASPSPSVAASAGASATAAASGSAAATASAAPSTSAAPSAASPASSASPAPSAGGTVTTNPADVASFALIWSPLAGVFFASAAAWYRRFLQLSNPNRAAQRGTQRGKPNNRRR